MNRTERTFAASVTEVGEARRFAAGALAAWGLVPDDVLLVVSELAANAVRHARSGFAMSLYRRESAVVVEVTDASPAVPTARSPGTGAPGGWGLQIVEHLAAAWGVRPRPEGGKTVWAEVPSA